MMPERVLEGNGRKLFPLKWRHGAQLRARVPFPARSVLGATMAILFLTACASPAINNHPVKPEGGGIGPIDWKNGSPLVGGLSVPSLASATSIVVFDATLPSNTSPPTAIYVTNPVAPKNEPPIPVSDLEMGAVFDDATYGLFWLIESPPKMSQADLEDLAATCDPDQGCVGSWTIATLSDGTRALEITGAGLNTGMMWLSKGVFFELAGPPDFTVNDAEAVESGLGPPSAS
jgi:hypothetical protein